MALVGEMQYLQIGDNTYQIKDKALEQVAATASSYTYWRPLLIGASSGSSESFTPSTMTDKSYTFPNITVQPSTGSIRINKLLLVNGSYKTTFSPTTLAANRTITIPDKTGTLALTSDVPVASDATPQALGTAAAGSSPDYSRADHVHAIPTYSKSDVGLGNVDNVQQYSASNPPPYPVTSVNGDTGAVTITVPAKTSDLTNDSGYITGMYIASYGSSTYAEVLAAYQANKVVYCRASSNSNPGTGSQNRMAFLAYVNNSTTPTEMEFQYYRSVSSHSDSQQGDQVYVYKLNSSGTWSVTTREAYTKVKAGTNMSSSYSSGVITLNATMPTVPSAATATPLVDGTAAVGSSTKYALEDHVHPTDTSRAAAGLGISSASAGQVVKISTVDSNGVPTAYTSGTASGSFTINLTQSGGTYSVDKTYDEIKTALESGMNCVVLYNVNNYIYIYPFNHQDYNSSTQDFTYYFANSYTYNSSTARTDGYKIYKQNNATIVQQSNSYISEPNIDYPQVPTETFTIYYDDEENKWVLNQYKYGIEDMYSVMLDNIIITLRKKLSSSDMANEENSEWYYLTKQYVTAEYSEEYGEDISTGHLVFQSVIEDNGIKKIKTITVSEEFYQFDYLESATITFSEEVVDITHCCSSTLSSSGWYRIATVADSGTSGSIYHFAIGRKTVAGVIAGQAHSIDFFSVGGGKSAFMNEVSDSNALYIDKIRCTYGNDLIHFDVHYSSSNAADVYVDFTVEGNTLAKQTAVAESLQAVADSPTGETVLTTYTFAANVPDASAGYTCLPDGTLIQWGQNGAYEGATTKETAVTFQKSFVDLNYAVNCVTRISGTDYQNYDGIVYTVHRDSVSKCTVHQRVVGAGGNLVREFMWTAIGRWK